MHLSHKQAKYNSVYILLEAGIWQNDIQLCAMFNVPLPTMYKNNKIY